jgi:hypothetical protein
MQRLPIPSPSTRAQTSRARLRRVGYMTINLALILSCLSVQRGHAEESSASADPGPAPITLLALMDHFAKSGTVRAEFKNTQTLSLLMDAIESEGVLYFDPPNRLARQTIWPGSSKVVIHDARVSFRDETGTRTMDLGSSTVARSLIDNLMVVLRGDLPGLRERYSVTFSADGQKWRFDLVPRLEAVRDIIEAIRFSGTGWILEAMETRETTGDTTLSVFSEIDTRLELSPAQIEKIFSVDSLDDDAHFRSPSAPLVPFARTAANR